jgi:hypothetical protein
MIFLLRVMGCMIYVFSQVSCGAGDAAAGSALAKTIMQGEPSEKGELTKTTIMQGEPSEKGDIVKTTMQGEPSDDGADEEYAPPA